MNRPNDEFGIAMEFMFAVFMLASRIHLHFAQSKMYELGE